MWDSETPIPRGAASSGLKIRDDKFSFTEVSFIKVSNKLRGMLKRAVSLYIFYVTAIAEGQDVPF